MYNRVATCTVGQLDERHDSFHFNYTHIYGLIYYLKSQLNRQLLVVLAQLNSAHWKISPNQSKLINWTETQPLDVDGDLRWVCAGLEFLSAE